MSNGHNGELSEPRYEYRVWGRHPEVGRRLSAWADEEHRQEVQDYYLLLGGSSCNVKIRRRKLKIKRLLELRDGFERWSVHRHLLAPVAEPASLVAGNEQAEDRAELRARQLSPSTQRALRIGWDGDAVLVTKHRRRFQIGDLRAEETEMWLAGQDDPLRTVAIEGSHLPDLVELRQSLAIAGLPNRAVHLAIEDRYRAAIAS